MHTLALFACLACQTCCGAIAASARPEPSVLIWVSAEDSILTPGETTVVTVWASFEPGVGGSAAFWLNQKAYTSQVLGFGAKVVWDLINANGLSAGKLGLPFQHNPAFKIDWGKYGTMSGGSIWTIASYNFSPPSIYFNPNATNDNPVWLFKATFAPTNYEDKEVEIHVGADNGAYIGVYVPDWPPYPPNPPKIGWVYWPVTYKSEFISIRSQACNVDCDNDGELTINDFICFQTLYAIGDPKADCDADGQLLIDDFICFQTAYAIGC